MAEILRQRFIKGAPAKYRYVVAVMLTLTFAVTQLDEVRGFLHAGGMSAPDFLFSGVLPALALNSVLTYVAFNGSLSALLLLRGTYSLAPVFMPILPRLNSAAWAVIECVMLFLTALIYHSGMNRQRRQTARKVKRQGRYQKQPLALSVVTVTLAALMIVFNLRAFGYFPVVVHSGSMAGEIDTGSVVIVEKLTPDEVLGSVKQGDVIHFTRGNVEIIHRVIQFDYNAAGERVYFTKGDANEVADTAPVEQGQVLGISRLGVRYIGYPSVWLKILFRESGVFK
jgi:signal peptidase